VTEIENSPTAREDIIRRGRVQLIVLARDLRRGAAREDTTPAPEALAYARHLARRGVPLDVFLRIHRLAHAVTMRAWEERLGTVDSATVLLAATRRLMSSLFVLEDGLIGALSAEYQRERERFVRSADAQRRETIHAVLDERPVDLDRAGSVLMHDLRRHHIGLILWARPTEEKPVVAPRLERAAQAAAQRLGCGRPLLLSESTGTMWAWLGTDSEPEQGLIEAFLSAPEPDGVSIALGEPGHGVAGFRRTHRDAVDAARVARLGERRPGAVTAYRNVELSALLAGDIDRSRRFVLDHLGRLASEEDDITRLRATLLPYLEENGSRIATARRLGIHPNTVANRIRTCSELLDCDLSRRPVRLQVALTLAATLGPAVLREAP
jgi:DNA-binding PucR family transcriptional regulator